jgi:hypothetical protein
MGRFPEVDGASSARYRQNDICGINCGHGLEERRLQGNVESGGIILIDEVAKVEDEPLRLEKEGEEVRHVLDVCPTAGQSALFRESGAGSPYMMPSRVGSAVLVRQTSTSPR